MPTTHALSSESLRLGRRDLSILLLLVGMTVATFANGLTGDFVIDDRRQIVRNDLIRDPHRWIDALRRDIWSFLGERDQPWSNYWRPGHVAWLIVNFRLFGATNALGWHVTNLLAHIGVVVCAFIVLRKLGASRTIAGVIIALFAVHPTRAESVTWIAGVHDVLSTLWQLCALLCVMSAWRDRATSMGKWIAAGVFYALAVCTKENAIFFPIVVAMIRLTDPDIASAPQSQRLRRAVLVAVPFASIAMVFLIARYFVLGRMQIPFAFRPSTTSVIATIPVVIVTYLRQIVFPYWIGWTYPVRAITGANATFVNFWLPILILAGVGVIVSRVRWDRLRVIGATLFALSLLPALNLFAFPPDNLVKDRFLYLPLLGFLMFLVPLVAEWGRSWFGARPALGRSIAAVGVLLLAAQTVRYNTAWRSDAAVWSWAVRMDPGSAGNHHQLAVALIDEDRLDEAGREIERALALAPMPKTYMARADLYMKQNRFRDALVSAREALDAAPDSGIAYAAYERLAVAHEKLAELDEAARVLREARERVPYRRAAFTDWLAVILYKQGDRAAAMAELEGARAAAETEFSPPSRLVLFHLGMLYHEMGRQPEGTATLRRFLELTKGASDPTIIPARKTARATIGMTPGS